MTIFRTIDGLFVTCSFCVFHVWIALSEADLCSQWLFGSRICWQGKTPTGKKLGATVPTDDIVNLAFGADRIRSFFTTSV